VLTRLIIIPGGSAIDLVAGDAEAEVEAAAAALPVAAEDEEMAVGESIMSPPPRAANGSKWPA